MKNRGNQNLVKLWLHVFLAPGAFLMLSVLFPLCSRLYFYMLSRCGASKSMYFYMLSRCVASKNMISPMLSRCGASKSMYFFMLSRCGASKRICFCVDLPMWRSKNHVLLRGSPERLTPVTGLTPFTKLTPGTYSTYTCY